VNTINAKLKIRVLGQFSIMHCERALAVPWPGLYARDIFCCLLSPLDDKNACRREAKE
jgi:hypothetical protein